MLYIEFELDNVKLKLINYELYYWYDKIGDREIKKPYWRKKILSKNSHGYLRTGINSKMFRFHRIVYYAHNPDWDITYTHDNQIDHIDRDKLNNNISNLRVVNHRENNLNKDSFDNAKGYCYDKRYKKYMTRIKLYSKEIHLGYFDTEIEASNKFQKVRLFVKVLKNIYKK